MNVLATVLLLGQCGPMFAGNDAEHWQTLISERNTYRQALDQVREEYGGAYALPAIDFFLFGMGSRDKYLYTRGALRNALTNEVVRKWDIDEELIVPSSYTVGLKTKDGNTIFIREDESSVWIEANEKREALSSSPVNLPDFNGHEYALVLRVLHQELLVNVMDGKPVPNFFVYNKPWYRDGAMMAMAFQKTGNLHLIKDWILGLREPYDRNNNGETEADNLGQALYLISLVSDRSHPLVPMVQKELIRFQEGQWIEGRSDFSVHAVYQTKWAKFGLECLGLDDPYIVPRVEDSYAALFWWAYKAHDMPGQSIREDDKYPYLGWASHHYAGMKAGKLSDRDYPLTWEAHASQANYEGIKRVGMEYTKRKICAPHTWHAAEVFLTLIEEPKTLSSEDRKEK